MKIHYVMLRHKRQNGGASLLIYFELWSSEARRIKFSLKTNDFMEMIIMTLKSSSWVFLANKVTSCDRLIMQP